MEGHQIIDTNVATNANTPREDSVNQARWILLPLFGLWIIFSVTGVILGSWEHSTALPQMGSPL